MDANFNNNKFNSEDPFKNRKNNQFRDGHAKMGKKFIAIAWVLAMLVVYFFFEVFFNKQRNPNSNIEGTLSSNNIAEVTLKRNNQNHYIFTGYVNGKAVDFLVDTGATSVVLSAKVARDLNLPQRGVSQAHTANGVVQVYNTVINELKIGSISLYNVKASINPQMHQESLLGMSALKNIEFTQRDGKLTLKKIH